MRLTELFLTQEDFQKKKEAKLKALKDAVEAGETPAIYNASGTVEGWAWGDLRDLGWAKKDSEAIGNTMIRERWIYTGPKPIKLLTRWVAVSRGEPPKSGTKEKILNTGDSSDWVEVDVS